VLTNDLKEQDKINTCHEGDCEQDAETSNATLDK